MKILIHSNAPWCPTGYGSQTAQIARRFRTAGHDVAISAFYGLDNGMIEWDGFTIYPSDQTQRGKQMLGTYARDHAGQGGSVDDVLVLTLMDVWTWLRDSEARFDGLRLAAWTPVDHDPVPPQVVKALQRFGVRPIAMSRFGERQLQAVGLDPLYVPHGIDTQVFQPPTDRAELRRELGLPVEAFIVGMVANNQGSRPSRKSFPEVFEAFQVFQRSHPEAILLPHTDIYGVYDGVNLVDLAHALEIPAEALGILPQEAYRVGTVTAEQVARYYGVMDVLANPAYGEGFGIPLVEAQACGVPVIGTDWTAMPELCAAGWLVDGERWYDAPQRSFFKRPSITGIRGAFEEAYWSRGNATVAAAARAFALDYDADAVFAEHWLPALAALDRPREVAPLRRRRARVAA